MSTTRLETTTFGYRHPLRPSSTITSFSVVDGNGIPASGELVTASFSDDDGATLETQASTDLRGRARFVVEHDGDPVDVVVSAVGEWTGPIRPAPGGRLVIEA
jgi:hypothetical protein